MSITLDATLKGENANSYATVEEADARIAQEFGNFEWLNSDGTTKKQLLIMATRQIDAFQPAHEKWIETQALNFPMNVNGKEEVGEVKEACIMQAYYLLTNYETIESVKNQAMQNIKTENLGKVQMTKSAVGFNPLSRYCDNFFKLIGRYIIFNNKVTKKYEFRSENRNLF